LSPYPSPHHIILILKEFKNPFLELYEEKLKI